MNDTELTGTPIPTTETAEHSDALAEAIAEDAATDAAQASYFGPDGKALPLSALTEPETVSRPVMMGTGGRLVLGNKPCRLSALTMLEADDAQAVLDTSPPLLYAAILTDPPAGGSLADIDPAAVARMTGAITQGEPLTEADARKGLGRIGFYMTREQRSQLAGIVLTSVRKLTPDVDEADVLGSLSIAEMVGCIRSIFFLSGGLAEAFIAG